MKFCKVCGSTLDTIISTKQVGCAECYFTFQEEFVQSFKNLGISSGYKGALPRRIKGYRSKLIDRMTMQLKLEDAIARATGSLLIESIANVGPDITDRFLG